MTETMRYRNNSPCFVAPICWVSLPLLVTEMITSQDVNRELCCSSSVPFIQQTGWAASISTSEMVSILRPVEKTSLTDVYQHRERFRKWRVELLALKMQNQRVYTLKIYRFRLHYSQMFVPHGEQYESPSIRGFSKFGSRWIVIYVYLGCHGI